ncbi:MAG: indolepyruvate oxidoreductase subunit beta family protein [Candidatus Tectomicrobia bacterium]|nr:indolepyruvate oxidoreductase subunit beta family protein [Candidatus Tectomicrobia bacterium]
MAHDGTPRVYKLLIAAIGGQGGNVLAEWLFAAAGLAGCEARFFSLPGLAQRGGATNLYLEIAAGGSPDELAAVNFSAHPFPGDIDIIIGQELLETGRLLQQGFGSTHATIFTSTTRVLTALEKMPMSGGIFDAQQLLALAGRLAGNLYAFDAVAKVRAAGLPDQVVNALLYGAVCEAGVLPIGRAHFLAAIDAVGVAPELNRRGFELGAAVVRQDPRKAVDPSPPTSLPANDAATIEACAAKLPASAAREYRSLVKQARGEFPEQLTPILSEALYQLIDYQDAKYARGYLDRLASMLTLDQKHGGREHGFACARTAARYLAIWMTYEDAIRVADLKSRAGRFTRIETEMNLQPGQRYDVFDYLKPDAEEIYGIFPNRIVEPLLRLFGRCGWVAATEAERSHYAQEVQSTGLFGYLKLWGLARLRFLRTASYRSAREMRAIDEWFAEVAEFLPLHYDLGCFAAQTAQLVKGYGRVRRRLLDSRRRLIRNVLRPLTQALDAPDRSLALPEIMRHARAALQLCLKDENGIAQAEAAVASLLAPPPQEQHAAAARPIPSQPTGPAAR